MMSTGLLTTTYTASGAKRVICGITDLTMSTLAWARSIRVCPGLRAMPTVTMTITAGVDVHRRAERGALQDVGRLALGLFLVDVDENDFGRHTVHGQGIRDGGAHITGAQNGDLLPFSHTVVSLNSIGLPGSGWLHKPRGTPSPAPR